MANTTRLVIGLNGEIISKTNGYIVASGAFSNMIQIVAPFPASDSVSMEFYLRNARITTYTQYVSLFKDDSQEPILAKDVVSSTESYYQTVKEWYVWQSAISPQAISAISRFHSGKVDLTVKFKEFRNLYVEEAILYKGSFGSRKSTTQGDLPTTSTIGDYYECDFLDYYSFETSEYYTVNDYAYYTATGWLKGVAYEYRVNSSATSLGIDPAVYGQDLETVANTDGELLASKISGLEAVVMGQLPEDYANNLFTRKEFDLNYPILTPQTSDVVLIERDRITYHTELSSLTLGIDEVSSDIIRTNSAINAITGTGFYADASNVLIGSAAGTGITWDGTDLFIRGTIQAGTITDQTLLDELKGDQGDSTWIMYSANSDGLDMTIGVVVDTEYIGIYIGQVASAIYGEYSWSKFIATDGAPGTPGDNGSSYKFIGVLEFLSDLSLIPSPSTNDSYRITETNELWVYSGSQWNNMGIIQGDSARWVKISGPQTFKFLEKQTIPVDTSIVLNAELNGGLTNYQWEYYQSSTSSWTILSGVSSVSTYTLSHDNAAWGASSSLRVRCLSNDSFFDTYSVVKLYDGDNALTVFLTNENISLSADTDGTDYDLTEAYGEFKVFDGVTDVSDIATYSITTATKNGLTISFSITPGELNKYSVSGGSWSTNTELFELKALYKGVTLTKVFTISKSKRGSQGIDPDYIVVSGPQQFKFLENASTPITLSLTLSAELYGALTLYDWEYWNGTSWTDLSGVNTNATYELTYNQSEWGIDQLLRIRCNSGVSYYDELTIVKTYDGLNGQNNYIHTAYATSDTGTDFNVNPFIGATYLGTVIDANETDPDASAPWAWVSYKGPQGDPGDSGTSVVIKGSVATVGDLPAGATAGDLYVVLADGDGYVWNGTTWDNVGQIQGPEGNAAYVHYAYSETVDNIPDTFSTSPFVGAKYVGVLADHTLVDSQVYADYSWSKYVGEDGSPGISATMGYLTNPFSLLPSASDGSGYDLTPTSGEFVMLYGNLDVTASSSFAVTNATKNGLTLSIGAATGIYTLAGASWTTDEETFELTGTYGSVVITLNISITKVKQGYVGDRGPGVTYKGVYDETETYYYNTILRDVVQYGGIYYAVKILNDTVTGPWVTGSWEPLSDFKAIATDILLAQDATILKGLVMGDGTNNGFIRTFGMTNTGTGTGFFLNGNGDFIFGDSADKHIAWDGISLSLNADISANNITAGNIDANTIIIDNLNASNITSGTIQGARLSIDANSTFSAGLIDSEITTIDGGVITTGRLGDAAANKRTLLDLDNASLELRDVSASLAQYTYIEPGELVLVKTVNSTDPVAKIELSGVSGQEDIITSGGSALVRYKLFDQTVADNVIYNQQWSEVTPSGHQLYLRDFDEITVVAYWGTETLWTSMVIPGRFWTDEYYLGGGINDTLEFGMPFPGWYNDTAGDDYVPGFNFKLGTGSTSRYIKLEVLGDWVADFNVGRVIIYGKGVNIKP